MRKICISFYNIKLDLKIIFKKIRNDTIVCMFELKIIVLNDL